ncbi:MAG: winged helix-turn-helix domain-containing protein [Candidatus Bathyarchaeota archaeon]|nr:winged helix-turn-helix domain-containing protein [Candidatus Bathyarchaeota archaeon]
MAPNDPLFRHILQWLIAGTRGGINRGRIILTLRDEPLNNHQLSQQLGLDYRTVRHHLDLMEKNGLIISVGDHYGKMYFVSRELTENMDDFDEIWGKIGNKLKKDKQDGTMNE